MMLAALDLKYSQALPWVILLWAGMVLLILLTYPPQLRQSPPLKRWILPGLRMLAVTAIAFSILRPVVTRQRVSTERAPVVVLFDNSRSMSVTDLARAPAELVGIAASLGRLPAETVDKQIQAVQTECDLLSAKADDVARCRAELDYARLSGRGQENAEARLNQAVAAFQKIARTASVEASQSMKNSPLIGTLAYLERVPTGVDKQAWLDRIRNSARSAAGAAEAARIERDNKLFESDPSVRELCKPLQLLSRLQLGETVVFDSAGGLLTRLGADTAVQGFGISDRVVQIAVDRHEADYQPLAADGTVSNLTGGIHAVLDSMSAYPPRAVVLFSDGRQTGEDNDRAAAVSQGVPIFTVGSASRSGIRDLTVSSVAVPSIATVGDPINVRIELRAPGLAGSSSTLMVTGGGPDEIRPITFGNAPMVVQLNRQFDTAGPGHLTFELTNLPGEMSYDNNKTERWIKVQRRQALRPDHPPALPPPATRPSTEIEMADLNGDEGNLRRLAESSGGQFFRLDQIDLLARRLNEIHDDVNHPVEIPLWDSPYLLAVVLGCLAAEWGLRKRCGLA
jgi:hypothetical protein